MNCWSKSIFHKQYISIYDGYVDGSWGLATYIHTYLKRWDEMISHLDNVSQLVNLCMSSFQKNIMSFCFLGDFHLQDSGIWDFCFRCRSDCFFFPHQSFKQRGKNNIVGADPQRRVEEHKDFELMLRWTGFCWIVIDLGRFSYIQQGDGFLSA